MFSRIVRIGYYPHSESWRFEAQVEGRQSSQPDCEHLLANISGQLSAEDVPGLVKVPRLCAAPWNSIRRISNGRVCALSYRGSSVEATFNLTKAAGRQRDCMLPFSC